MISGDIGCYTLSSGAPYNAIETTVCMGASISLGHGAQQIFDTIEGENRASSRRSGIRPSSTPASTRCWTLPTTAAS